MKKLWRRVLLLSVMFVLAMSVRSLAATTYSAKTITFPNSYGGGWSNQFTLSSTTKISVGVNIYNNYTRNFQSLANQINSRLSYRLQNVYTGTQYTLTDISYNSLNYEVHKTVPAGTYSFGVYYSGIYSFNLYFRITGDGGTNVLDSIQMTAGTDRVVDITNPYGGNVNVDASNSKSSNGNVAYISNVNNNTSPSQITIHAVKKGSCKINVAGTDGSTYQISVKVVAVTEAPKLLYYDLSLDGGEIVYNEVLNADSTSNWASSKKSVATVNQSGKITAVGYGTATITVTAYKNGVSYYLPCVVNVSRSDPQFVARITSLNPSKKTVKVSITNTSGVKMIVYSADSYLLNYPDYLQIRQLKLKGYNSFTIKNKKTQALTFTIKGAKVSGSKTNFAVRFKFKVDGKVYYARVNTDGNDAQYILKKNLSTDNWLYSSPDVDD